MLVVCFSSFNCQQAALHPRISFGVVEYCSVSGEWVDLQR